MIPQRVLRSVSFAKSLPRVSRRFTEAPFKGILVTKWPRRIPAAVPFTAMGMLGFVRKTDDAKESKLTAQEILLAKADALFDQYEYKKIYELLNNYKDSKNVEVLWRLGRALYNMSRTASEVECKNMTYEGYDLVSTALSIDPDHYAVHKWMAVFLDAKNNYEGMKARIKELNTVKQHMMVKSLPSSLPSRAAELNPKDATTLYMLGSWCYGICDLAWYQRKIASAVFGELPKSSFEEALKYFETAEKIDPNFYSHNLLMLGKTYLKLEKREEAVKYLKMASEYEARNDDDHDAKKQALKLLGDLGFKS